MHTILISGSASGIGRAFVNHFVQDLNNHVIAVDKAPIKLDDLESKDKNSRTYRVDVTSNAEISTLASLLEDHPIDLLIHSAGIRGLVPAIENEFPNDVAKAETIDAMDGETMMRTFQINTVGTFFFIRAFLPHLRLSPSPKVIIMSSRMGSLSNNTTGGGYAYRASKAALNAVVKSFSIDVPDVTFALVHPGRVESGLVKCREEGAIEVEESVQQMVPLINQLEKDRSGAFLDRFGKPIAW